MAHTSVFSSTGGRALGLVTKVRCSSINMAVKACCAVKSSNSRRRLASCEMVGSCLAAVLTLASSLELSEGPGKTGAVGASEVTGAVEAAVSGCFFLRERPPFFERGILFRSRYRKC